MDREARSVAIDADPTSGMLREPIVKILSVMRSMEFQSYHPVLNLRWIKRNTGQDPHSFDSVFSFFLPEFEPYGRVGDAKMFAPEATLLDMPKIIGIMNGLQSLVKYGLSRCSGGFGSQPSCREQEYRASELGVLQYARRDPDSEFSKETFEGPSLMGGLDNEWVGRTFKSWTPFARVVEDPLSTSNHVLRPEKSNRARIFSPRATTSASTVIKFKYYGTKKNAGGCIGYVDTAVDEEKLNSETWVYCDANSGSADNVMRPNENSYISCQFEIPNNVKEFRVVVGDTTSSGEAYFDNIHVSTGSGTTCFSVTIDELIGSGEVGFSTRLVDDLATLLTAGRLNLEHRRLVVDAYDKAGSANDGLKVAQQIILSCAEFHTTNMVQSTGTEREKMTFPEPSGKPYKAIVYLMFKGGCDSFNMLVPYSCSSGKDMYQVSLVL